MTTVLQDALTFFGRIAFSLMFVLASYDKIVHFSETAAMMTAKGVPMSELWLIIAIIFELGGGLMILLGIWSRFGALLIFLFVIPVTYFFHNFWALLPPEDTNQLYHFLKNLTILGGSLYIMAFGSGRWSIDRLWKRRGYEGERAHNPPRSRYE